MAVQFSRELRSGHGCAGDEEGDPVWRGKVAELGDEKGSVEWARAELERYHCPACGKPLFRGAKRCRACKEEVAEVLDGTL